MWIRTNSQSIIRSPLGLTLSTPGLGLVYLFTHEIVVTAQFSSIPMDLTLGGVSSGSGLGILN